MKFIKLTTTKSVNGSDSFYLNSDLIESFDSFSGNNTTIFMHGSVSDEYYSVKETPEEILQMIYSEE